MSILRYEENGIEFFTVEATGESGISYSGLAILCGVNQSTITRLITKLEDLTPCNSSEQKCLQSNNHDGFNPMHDKRLKRLKAFIGKELHLEGVYKKQGGEVKILRADFCAAVIKHYALEGRAMPSASFAIAEHSMDKFMTLGINSWIQSITGWQVCPTSKSSFDYPQDSVDIATIPNIEQLLEQIEILKDNLKISLKHRHAIHNIVEKPTVVDLSLNQIIHTAVHVQAQKLNQALATLQLIRNNALALQSMNHQIKRSQQLWRSITQLTNTVEQTRIENNHLKGIVRQQKALLQSRRQTSEQNRVTATPLELERVLVVRIEEIYNILMTQQRTGGTRGMNTCTKKAKIYARYEIGQSLIEIAQALKIPYETVKTYVKLTRAELRKHNSQLN